MPSKGKSNLTARLKKLPPQEFENLTYDLLFLSGAQNLRWRTPGTDGGRDLEAEFPMVDFSGESGFQKWYVECKRYAQAVNWPTVYEKLTVAINHNADFLLFVTTSNFSSACRDEVQRHNASGRGPQLRIWPFYRLAQLLALHGQIAVKYGLVDAPQALHVDFEKIVFELTKLTQSIYAAAEFGRPSAERIELLAAFTELLSARIADVREYGRFASRKFKPDRDSYDWCRPTPLPAVGFDAPSLRAALASIRTILDLELLECSPDKGCISIAAPATNVLRSNQLFGLVTSFGLIDCEYRQDQVIFRARRQDD